MQNTFRRRIRIGLVCVSFAVLIGPGPVLAQSGSSTTAVVVSSSKIIGEGLSGSVSPSGATNSVGNYDGITVISSGHVSGRSGAGTFKRSDGCVGRWTASKQ